MMPVSNDTMRRVLEEHVEAENVHDRDRVLATYAREAPVFEDVPSGQRFVGPEAIVDNYRHLWDGFPGLARRIDRWTFGENSCVIELTLTGEHAGHYRGIAPTGRQLQLRISAHFAFDEDGRITQETAYYDTLTFMRQLGLGRS
jgi:steroid delta-isomerase-like uncharacterized protein